MAQLRRKDPQKAAYSLINLEQGLQDSQLSVRLMPFNKPVQCGRIAAWILKGELLFEEGKTGESIKAFEQAVEEEDKLIYREPQDWLIPARQYLGAYLLKMNRAKDAENVYREDLVLNPANGWSLLGMYNSLAAQNKIQEAAKFKAAYIHAFKSADVKPLASVF